MEATGACTSDPVKENTPATEPRWSGSGTPETPVVAVATLPEKMRGLHHLPPSHEREYRSGSNMTGAFRQKATTPVREPYEQYTDCSALANLGDSVPVNGKRVDHDGVELNHVTADSIVKMPVPVSKAELRSFMGQIKHCPDTRPEKYFLDELLSPDVKFQWNWRHQLAKV